MSSSKSKSGSLDVDVKSVNIAECAQGSTKTPSPAFTPEQQKKLWRKIDARIMPVLTIMYLFSFMDRGNIGNAKLEGLTSQLQLTGNKYNIALTMYFIVCLPLLTMSLPFNPQISHTVYSNAQQSKEVLKKFRPSRWLPGITLLWGTIMALMGLVKTYPQLVGTRILLGVTEAGLFPGVVYYMTLWYPRHMLQLRVGVFYGGATLAGAFSGLLAYGISFMSGTAGMLGKIIEGIATVIVGFISFFILVDFPDTATFLTPEERAYVIWTKKYDNSSVGEEEHFELRHLIAAFTDWQIWLQILVYFSIVMPLYGITIFLPTIINDFGYNTAISELLTVPPYVFATILVVVFAAWSDHIKMRSPFIIVGLAMCLFGFAINISDAPNGVKYFGTFFCVAGAYAAFPGSVAWLGNNLAGQYKRAVGMALQIGVGNFSAAIASNVYISQDAPRYIMGHAIALMFIGIGFIFLPLTVIIYKHINTKRDIAALNMRKRYTDDELRRMGDRAPDFRYTL
ncbi:uncharacterized protein FIBRA_01925 [Fibroporia radiculosa]|uniref:Major facilitator superfamily (MFS) profile domain-containing protein n=1 Tax=Fibroporia radiculosa TaxID=599839 RepID=J4GLV7_9APHY|nr:uncharacterized protein FIBRA_01925 [Fibroporia radiculosa]CCL99900.1 predicted protein [Fibroporia radiculosa]